jgi:3'-phosphoadenosine 5'-phosphosulfate sulfotransferase (PAPS reductase)/FAD synthetase
VNGWLAAKVREANDILDDAALIHGSSHTFGMFSGGHDSLVATHLASHHPSFSGAAHMNTTIGIEETRQFVRDTCERHQWRLHEKTGPKTYREVILKYGFPGPGGHIYMYSWLKERALRKLVREHKQSHRDRIALVTGVRLSESSRRMGHVKPIVREGAKVWIAPILNWTDDDKNEYIEYHRLERNPVVANLCMSGECLCGAFAHPGELAELAVFYPSVAADIRALMVEAEAAGVHAKWGERPPKIRQGMCQQCELKLEWAEPEDVE